MMNMKELANSGLTKERDCMRKIIELTLMLFCILGLCGCNNNTTDSVTKHEAVSVDFGKVTELDKAEFEKVFKEFEDVQIEENVTMARTDDSKEIVVQFKYSSSNGNGVYGFLYNLDDYANPELAEQGKDITIDNLLR